MMDPANCAKKARAILGVVAARRETTDRSTEEAVQIAQAWIALGQLEYLLLQQTPVDQRKAVSDESGDTEPRQMVMVDEPRTAVGIDFQPVVQRMVRRLAIDRQAAEHGQGCSTITGVRLDIGEGRVGAARSIDVDGNRAVPPIEGESGVTVS